MSLINIEKTVTLDVYDHDTTPSVIKAIQMDKGTRTVYAGIQNSRQDYDIGQNASVSLTVLRPDKTKVQITGQPFISYTGTDSTMYGAKAELSDVALAVKGNLKAQFKITSGEQELRTEIFTINNGEALDAGDGDWAGDLDGHNLDEMAESIETLQTDMTAVNEDVSDLKEDLNAKVDIAQGVAHAGEALIIGEDGNVTTGEAGVSVDTTLSIAGKAADAKAAGDAIEEISDQLFVTAEVPASATVASYRLNESDGFCSANNEYQLKKYEVSVGTNLRIKSDDRFQFQKSSSVPTSGTSNRVGDTTYGAGTFHLTVPNGATYLIVSTPKASSVAIVETIEYKIEDIESKTQALEDRTLKDSIAPYLAKYGNRIREIDLTSYLFDGKTSSIPFYNTATEKSDLNCPAQTVYQGIRLGTRILYLPKGSVVITNIDSVYDLSTMAFKNYPIGDRRGIILANYANNNQTITGTVAFGREKFDGKYREILIGYTDYYTLSYRTDVDYTNKLYVYYPKDHDIESDDVRVTDITADVRMYDGTVAYNAVSGWTDNTTSVNGAAGTYSNKSTFLHLMGNSGKSLYIDGMELNNDSIRYPTVIHYDDNGDDTYTPTTKFMTFNRYTVAKHNYITIPLTDEDHIRVQFVATACSPFVRFLIVPNELLFEKGLANPVFYGKKIVGYGDSYIAGQGITYTWHHIIAMQNYAEYVNRGHGGAGLCYGGGGSLIASGIISELDENADIYFLCFGRNDNSVGIAIGNNDDYPDTSVTWDSAYLLNHVSFKAGMNYLFEYLESRHPYAKIIAVTPWGFVNNEGVTSGLSCLDYIDAMQEISKKWGITCFNAAGDAGIHVRIEAFRTQYFLASNDQSHLNNDGHALMAKRATKLLTNILYDD